jgi:hypothetical protein
MGIAACECASCAGTGARGMRPLTVVAPYLPAAHTAQPHGAPETLHVGEYPLQLSQQALTNASC